MTKAFTDIDAEALDALIQRVTDAKEHQLTLSAEDCQLLLDALVTLASLQEKLAGNDITIKKLRKLIGIVASSESLSKAVSGASGEEKTPGRDHKLRSKKPKPKTTPVKPKVVYHPLVEPPKGDKCPQRHSFLS